VKNVTIKNIEVHPSNGLSETLAQMNYLEKLSFQNQPFVKFVYQNFHSNCISCIPGKIWNYIKNNFQYKFDDPYDEQITAPYVLLQTKQGDCDDFALFAKTCLDILGGWNTSYLLLGRNWNEFTHIICFAHRGTVGNHFVDPVRIDGANETFDHISEQYKFYKFV
jgi:hypothetical protein